MKKGEFDGKVVLITGAASGLGRAASVRFAREGARVCLADINSAGLERCTTEIALHQPHAAPTTAGCSFDHHRQADLDGLGQQARITLCIPGSPARSAHRPRACVFWRCFYCPWPQSPANPVR